MELKVLTHPDGRTFKMGRRVPRARHYGLRLANYLDPSKIDLPDAASYADKAMACLGQMDLNDRLGDCTAAAAFHIEGVFQGNLGTTVKFTNKQVEAFYSATTGYVPGKPETDQGGDETTVLNFWRDHGLYKNGHKIAGHATVDGTNWDLVRAAIYLFENVYYGMSLPDAWVNPMPSASGWTWDVAGDPDEQNGHCVAGIGYVADEVIFSSWGMLGHITKAATAKYTTFANGGELHTVFSYDGIDKASRQAPNGFAADELWDDFKKFAVA